MYMSIKIGYFHVIFWYAIATVTGRDQSLDFKSVECHCNTRIYVVQPILLQEITFPYVRDRYSDRYES